MNKGKHKDFFSKLKEFFSKLNEFFLKLKEFFSKLKDFFTKLKVSEKTLTNVRGKTTKKTPALREEAFIANTSVGCGLWIIIFFDL